MKNRSVSLSLLTATLFAIPAFAADVAPAAPAAPSTPAAAPGPRGPWREELIKRFDTDGDGKLNDAEKAEARKARGEMREQWAPRGAKMSEELKQKFDANKDGQLDDGERQAAREAMREKWAAGGGPGGFHGPRGHGGEPPMWMRRELHRWFEQKWGGHPGPMHARSAGLRGRMHAQLTKRFDQDGDGKLNDTERAAAKQAGDERRARREQHRKDVLARFDQDGDGQLSDTERKNVQDAWDKFLQQQPVVKPAAK